MVHQPNLLPLKVLVISLGLVLAGGFVFVLMAISQKTGTSAPCPDATLHLGNPGGTMTGIAPQGDKVQITFVNGTVVKVLTADRCTGKVLQTLTVTP